MNFRELVKQYNARVTQEYGKTQFAQSGVIAYPNNFHDGIDTAGGQYNKSFTDGVVLYAGNNSKYGRAYGNVVEIQLPNGDILFYGHFDSIDGTIKQGVQVKTGQRLGVQGSTGQSTGIHLHIGGRRNNRSISPEIIINEYFSQKNMAQSKYPIGTEQHAIRSREFAYFTLIMTDGAVEYIRALGWDFNKFSEEFEFYVQNAEKQETIDHFKKAISDHRAQFPEMYNISTSGIQELKNFVREVLNEANNRIDKYGKN